MTNRAKHSIAKHSARHSIAAPGPGKRAQILKTAGAMFIEHGYGAVSMDALAEAVPVSKPTLYNHFGDKKALFLAVMEERCAGAYETFGNTLQDDGAPRLVLSRFAQAFLDFVLTDRSIALYRLMVAEARSFPELGETFYSAGPRQVQSSMADWLRRAHEAGELSVPDALRSASLFMAMIGGEHWKRALLGIASKKDEPEIQATLSYAIEMFLKAHAVDAAGEKPKSKA